MEKEKERVAGLLGISSRQLFDSLLPLQALYASADHLKTLLFAITDGILPSNAGGGYNLRMILRRTFGFSEQFGYELDVPKVLEGHARHLKYIFPHLGQGLATSIDVIGEERKRYLATKEKARTVVAAIVTKAKGAKGSGKERAGAGRISKNKLAVLYKSNGIPPEYVSEIASENGVEVEMPGNFYSLIRGGEGEERGRPDIDSRKVLAHGVVGLPRTTGRFYTLEESFQAKVLAIISNKYVVLDTTAFYPEGGGQVADTGYIEAVSPGSGVASSRFPVSFVTKEAGVVLHEVTGDVSKLKAGAMIKGVVDLKRRKAIARHHACAHLVNAACREVLGPHIWQAGSYKDEFKAHLDVTHYRRISPEELKMIELKVNEYIMRNMPITIEILPRNTAEERYGFRLYQGGAVPGKELRVVSMGDVDVEACGGTHQMLKTTGEIGAFKIVKREGIQDGIERIIYKAGDVAIRFMQEKEDLLRSSSEILSVSEGELAQSVERFFREWKEQRKSLEKLGSQMVAVEAREIIEHGREKPIVRVLELDATALRQLGQTIAESDCASACLMNKEGSIVCAAGRNSRFKAKDLLSAALAQLGGTGGGSERIAQGKAAKVGVVEL